MDGGTEAIPGRTKKKVRIVIPLDTATPEPSISVTIPAAIPVVPATLVVPETTDVPAVIDVPAVTSVTSEVDEIVLPSNLAS